MTRVSVALAIALSLGCSRGSTPPPVVRPTPTPVPIAPVSHYHDLVAGGGGPGFADGPFTRARFNAPTGLCQSADGSRLFVADRANNRIRVIRLSERNRVETLCGTGEPGHVDGPFETATFAGPSVLVTLPGDSILVYEQGSGLFRRVSLSARTVTTLRVGDAPVDGVWAVAPLPGAGAVLFSQPGKGALSRLELATGAVTEVLSHDPRLEKPAALTIHGGAVVVSDLASWNVFRLGPSRAPEPPDLTPVGRGARLVALASSGGRLYGLSGDSDTPWIRVDEAAPVEPWSVWGGPLPLRTGPFLPLPASSPAGLLADARSERALFVSGPGLESVLELRDYSFAERRDGLGDAPEGPTGVDDFEVPVAKTRGTVRVLLAGDSHLFQGTSAELAAGHGFERILTIPKRAELSLATRAALEGRTARYEVLHAGRISALPLLVWTAYRLPALAKRYDVDTLVLMVPPFTPSLQAYLERPITAEGIPSESEDPEYRLKPWQEKLARNPARKLYEICLARDRASVASDSYVVFHGTLGELASAPETRAEVVELLGRLVGRLASGLGGRTRLVLCFYPLGGSSTVDREGGLFREICERRGVEFLDLTDDLTALRPTYYPLSEMGGGSDHFNAGGHALLGEVLAFELVRRKLIPY